PSARRCRLADDAFPPGAAPPARLPHTRKCDRRAPAAAGRAARPAAPRPGPRVVVPRCPGTGVRRRVADTLGRPALRVRVPVLRSARTILDELARGTGIAS